MWYFSTKERPAYTSYILFPKKKPCRDTISSVPCWHYKIGEHSPQKWGASLCFCYISWTPNLVTVVMLHFKNIPLLHNETLQQQFFTVMPKRLKAGPQKMGGRSTTAFCYAFQRQFMPQTAKDKCHQSQNMQTLPNWLLSPILFVAIIWCLPAVVSNLSPV